MHLNHDHSNLIGVVACSIRRLKEFF